MIRAIVFDLDDTLYREKDYVKSGFKTVSQWIETKFRKSDFYKIAINLFNSGKRNYIFDETLKQLGIQYNKSIICKIVDIYRSHDPKIHLYREAELVINSLKDKVKLGLITDGYLISQKQKIKALKLNRVINTIIYSDSFGRKCWKPSPIPYEQACIKLKCKPTECVYIGDNITKDFITAKKLGWTTVHIKKPESIYFDITRAQEYEAHYQITNLNEIFFIEEISRSINESDKEVKN